MAHQPRVIVTNSEPAIQAVNDAAGPIPTVMAIVGEGMVGTPGIAARVFTALAGSGISVVATLAGCSSASAGPRELRVEVKEFAFTPPALETKVGQPVRVTRITRRICGSSSTTRLRPVLTTCSGAETTA